MQAADHRGATEALEWLCGLALRSFEGAEEPGWLDELNGHADEITEGLITVLAEASVGSETSIGAIGIGLARWFRATGRISEGCDWLLRMTARCGGNHRLSAEAAQLLISAGRLDEALGCAADAGPEELALVAMGHIGVIRATYAPAEAQLRRAAASTSPEVVFEATVVLAQAATRQQRYGELAALASKAQLLAWESGLDRQLAQALLLSHNAHRLQGRRTQAEAAAQEALEVAGRARAVTLVAVALGALGGLRVEDGDPEGARGFLRRSLELTAHGGDVRTTMVTTSNLGETERLAGNAAAARQLFGSTLRYAKTLGDERAVGFMLTALAELALAEGEPAAAAEPLREAVQLRAKINDSRGLVLSLEGTVAWAAASGRHVEAAQLLGAADAARAELGMEREPQLVHPLEQALSNAPLAEAEIAAARRLGDTLDLEAATGLAVSLLGGAPVVEALLRPASRAVAALQLLGGFSLTVNGVLVNARAWQSRKARDLLKILAVAQGHPVTRESVMDSLWPDAPPAALPPRLSVALSTLRSVLGPARDAVIADRDALALDLTLIEVDVVTFHRLVARGDYERAVENYTGELLPGDVFAEWPTLAREQAAAAFAQAAHAAADAAAEAGRYEETALLCRRVIAADPYDERAHQRLIDALRRNGAHGDARRADTDYVQRMTEIGVTVRPNDRNAT